MLYYGQLVIGPGGSGKSTYCSVLKEGAQMCKRNIQVINLDPAAEYLPYEATIDIRDLISLQDVMEEYELGPNGGLVYCMEYLLMNMDWFQEEVNNIAQDDYVLIDCPGQIELYCHMDMMRKLTKFLTNMGFALCSVYLLDVNFIQEDSKYLSGLLQGISASMTLELAHFIVLSKCDLIEDKKIVKKYTKLQKFNQECEYSVKSQFEKTYKNLSEGIFELVILFFLFILFFQKVYQFGGSKLLSLDVSDEESVLNLLHETDYAIQWGENLEPDDKMYDEAEKQ